MKKSNAFGNDIVTETITSDIFKDYRKQIIAKEYAMQLKASGTRFNVNCVVKETLVKSPDKQYIVMDNIPEDINREDIISDSRTYFKYLMKHIEIYLEGTREDIDEFIKAVTIN